MINILFADDHEMVRIGVSAYLSAQPDMKVIAEANDGKTAVEKALSLKPDIILMDLVMDEMDGIEATEQIISKWPEAKIIVVTSFIDDEKVYPALEAGAMSYLLKTSKASEIAAAIRATFNGESILEPEVTGKMMHKLRQKRLPHEELTPRELEILLLIAEGKSNQDIADELYIAVKTVKVHVSNTLSKLEVQDRTQAVVYAFKHNLA
ncbi:response regulator transcription factor [Pseudogracilibacillus sp. SE30717A]|uniref:response regulator transcription factor n=1 Tax=Pseudogracilibacillus sp. SE30717A TaxID=3098293 RepID=UPI00300E3174